VDLGDEVDFMQDYAPYDRVILLEVLNKEKALQPQTGEI
jgi:hypothetical protein